MAEFADVRFPDDIAEGAVGGPSWSTTIVTSASGWEQRQRNWSQARRVWNVGSNIHNGQRLAEVLAFWNAVNGPFCGFRFRDWTDHYVGMAYQLQGEAFALVHTESHPIGTGDGVTTQFPLTKSYVAGGREHVRDITRPVAPIRVYLDDVNQVAGWTCNYATGVVTFSVPPANGVVVGWSGQFDVPVRFEADGLDLTLEAAERGTLDIRVVEIRERA